MKKFLSTLTVFAAVAIIATSCTSAPAPDGAVVKNAGPDTTGLAQFQQWKAQNELASMNQYMTSQQAAAQPAAPATKTIVKYVPVKSATRTTTYSSESANTAKASQKKGWSKSAKGAVIGGAGGAVVGAIISKKNPVLGGIVGGVLGAGAGYGIGHGMDKKDGRY